MKFLPYITTILAFVFLAVLMLVIDILYIREPFLQPVFEYATKKWVTPRKNKYIGRFGDLGANTGWMTITFWIDMKTTFSNWRNVFHVSQSTALEYSRNNNPASLPYDSDQDLYRRPALFIGPNRDSIHICHDTRSSRNNPFDVDIPKRCHIGLVWRSQENPFSVTCTCYVNDRAVKTYTYNDWLAQPDSDALIYMCDRFYGDGGFQVRDFNIFNKPLSQQEYLDVYNTTNAQMSTILPPTGTTNIRISHPDGRQWKNNGNTIMLNQGGVMSLDIYNGADVYGNASGRIALFQNGNRGLSVRHTGFIMYTHGFAANNFDFAWYFMRSGDGVMIYNDYGGGYYVGYDAASDRVLIVQPGDSRIVLWRLDPMPSTEFVN